MNTVWKIVNAKRNPSTGFIKEVMYAIHFELEGESDRHVGVAKFEGDASATGFISFEQLTEPIIIDWVKGQLGEEKVASIIAEAEQRIQKVIDKKKNPESLQGLPWSK